MRVFFLRDRTMFPVACLASEKIDTTIKVALSIHNPIDTFNRSRGRDIAEKRLQKGKLYAELSADRPKVQLMWKLFNDKELPTRVRKAAEVWLREHDEFPDPD